MRNTLDEALAAVFGAGPPSAPPPAAQPPSAQPPGAQPPPARPPGPAQELPGQAQWLRARELFDKADRQLRSGDWAGYGATMKELRKVVAEGAAAAQGK
jgi:uncharacterized membrane protein (UPF0182 family)